MKARKKKQRLWMALEFYTDSKGEWRGQMRARNGEIVWASSEGFRARVKAVKNFCLVTGVDEVEIKRFIQRTGPFRIRFDTLVGGRFLFDAHCVGDPNF